MKKTLVIAGIFLIVIASITMFLYSLEEFKIINPKSFNKQIEARNDIKTPEELIKLYYNYPSKEGNPHFKLSKEKIDSNTFIITLIRERIEDDSVWGEKVIMKAVRKNETWIALEIKTNWKCQSGRNYGWPKWGIEVCS